MGDNNANNMRFLKASPACILQLFLLAGLFFFSGCATTPESLFTVSGAGWTVQQGQALWTPRHGAPQLGGDIVLATDANGRALVQFEKMPLPLVTAQVTPE